MVRKYLPLRQETGQRCDSAAMFEFDGYVDGSGHPEPRLEERRTALSKGRRFPPIRSSGKSCYWRRVDRKNVERLMIKSKSKSSR
jgi:hypothetical protein